MKNIITVLNEKKEIIINKAQEWKYGNVQVYVSSNVPAQKKVLNLLVEKANSEQPASNVDLLRLDLEQLLECAVDVTTSELIGDYLYNKIKIKSAPLDDFEAIKALFKEEDQDLKPAEFLQSSEEREKLASDLAIIKTGLFKRKNLEQEATPAEKAKQFILINEAELRTLEQMVTTASSQESSENLNKIQQQVKKVRTSARSLQMPNLPHPEEKFTLKL